MIKLNKKKIAVIGQGYVGLPLAIEFGKITKTIGFDINKERVNQLKKGIDYTKETTKKEIKNSKQLKFSFDINDIKKCNIYIVTVPTPIDKHKNPDLTILKNTTLMLGKVIKKQDIIIYESTVYPGCTEEICIPLLEKKSKLKGNNDFFYGYSPERIVPGNKKNTLTKIIKVTSGCNEIIAEEIDKIYGLIIKAGTYKAPSIKVAEAAKVIENTQRDLNISFVNELALIFDRLGVDTQDVLNTADTKWNFIKFNPGLVGGHCISVDPYYLSHISKRAGYFPEVILSGRRVNDKMSVFVANKMIKLLINSGFKIKQSKVLILGITFKENCSDLRNSKVIDVYRELLEFGISVDVFDYTVNEKEIKKKLGINIIKKITEKYEGILLAVGHKKFTQIDIEKIKKSSKSIVYDLKGFLPRKKITTRL